jgi:hypothetical protein
MIKKLIIILLLIVVAVLALVIVMKDRNHADGAWVLENVEGVDIAVVNNIIRGSATLEFDKNDGKKATLTALNIPVGMEHIAGEKKLKGDFGAFGRALAVTGLNLNGDFATYEISGDTLKLKIGEVVMNFKQQK